MFEVYVLTLDKFFDYQMFSWQWNMQLFLISCWYAFLILWLKVSSFSFFCVSWVWNNRMWGICVRKELMYFGKLYGGNIALKLFEFYNCGIASGGIFCNKSCIKFVGMVVIYGYYNKINLYFCVLFFYFW